MKRDKKSTSKKRLASKDAVAARVQGIRNKQEKRNSSFSNRIIKGGYCIYLFDNLNWVVESNVRKNAKNKIPRVRRYYSNFENALLGLLELITDHHMKKEIKAIAEAIKKEKIDLLNKAKVYFEKGR